jgi:hypothetical protein
MIASGLQIYLAFAHLGRGARPTIPTRSTAGRSRAGPPVGGLGSRAASTGIRARLAVRAHRLLYLGFLVWSGEWRSLLFRPRDVGPAIQMQLYYLRLRREHPPQGSTTRCRKARTRHRAARRGLGCSAGSPSTSRCSSPGSPRCSGVRAGALLALLGGVDLHRLHAAPRDARMLVDPASLRAMISGMVPGEVPQPWLTRRGEPAGLSAPGAGGGPGLADRAVRLGRRRAARARGSHGEPDQRLGRRAHPQSNRRLARSIRSRPRTPGAGVPGLFHHLQSPARFSRSAADWALEVAALVRKPVRSP